MREDNKSLLLAIILSMAVLIGWNVFFTPAVPPQRAPQTAQTPGAPPPTAAPSPSQAGGPAIPVPGTLPAPTVAAPSVEPRDAAIARSPRVLIDTPALRGSINLKG